MLNLKRLEGHILWLINSRSISTKQNFLPLKQSFLLNVYPFRNNEAARSKKKLDVLWSRWLKHSLSYLYSRIALIFISSLPRLIYSSSTILSQQQATLSKSLGQKTIFYKCCEAGISLFFCKLHAMILTKKDVIVSCRIANVLNDKNLIRCLIQTNR